MTGALAGAASSLYAERVVRHTLESAAARLQPDALVTEVGRTARKAARSTGGRVRDAFAAGRTEMLRREEELWAELSPDGTDAPSPGDGAGGPTAPGVAATPALPARGTAAALAPTTTPPDRTAGPAVPHAARVRARRRATRSHSHLGK
jgi:hypothetical protein